MFAPEGSPPHKPTCGEVDVSEEYNVGGDKGYQLGDANLLLEVDVNDVLLSQRAVGAGMQQLEARAEAAEEPEMKSKQEDVTVTQQPARNSEEELGGHKSSRKKLCRFTQFSPGLTAKVCSAVA